jgi:hypothetical protein
MSVVYQYSSLLTDGAQDGTNNLAPNTQFRADPTLSGGAVNLIHGSCYVPTDDISEGPNVFALARFKSNDRLYDYEVGTSGVDPSTGSLVWQTGVYKANLDGTIGSLVGSATSIATVAATDALIMGAGNFLQGSNSNSGIRAIWEFAGYTSDPGGDFYVCVTNAGADVTTAVTCRFTFQYTTGD